MVTARELPRRAPLSLAPARCSRRANPLGAVGDEPVQRAGMSLQVAISIDQQVGNTEAADGCVNGSDDASISPGVSEVDTSSACRPVAR